MKAPPGMLWSSGTQRLLADQLLKLHPWSAQFSRLSQMCKVPLQAMLACTLKCGCWRLVLKEVHMIVLTPEQLISWFPEGHMACTAANRQISVTCP